MFSETIPRDMLPFMSQPQQVGCATEKITIHTETSANRQTGLRKASRDWCMSACVSSGPTILGRCKEMSEEQEKKIIAVVKKGQHVGQYGKMTMRKSL